MEKTIIFRVVELTVFDLGSVEANNEPFVRLTSKASTEAFDSSPGVSSSSSFRFNDRDDNNIMKFSGERYDPAAGILPMFAINVFTRDLKSRQTLSYPGSCMVSVENKANTISCDLCEGYENEVMGTIKLSYEMIGTSKKKTPLQMSSSGKRS